MTTRLPLARIRSSSTNEQSSFKESPLKDSCLSENGVGRNGLLLTDLDNTLYDFPAFFEAGLIGAVDFLSTALRVNHQQLIEDFAAVFTRVGTIEYSFAIQELATLQRLPMKRRQSLAEAAAGVFWKRGSVELRSYPSVEPTLRHLALSNIVIIGLTDAPYREVLRRLRFLGLDVYLSRLFAQADPPRRPAPIAGLRLSRVPGYVRGRHRPAQHLGLDRRKPSSDVIREIVAEWSAGPRVAVGDSVQRDLVPTMSFGFTCLYAAYGARTPDEHPMLMSVVPDVLPEVQRAQVGPTPANTEFEPISSFHDVISYFPIQQQFSLDGER